MDIDYGQRMTIQLEKINSLFQSIEQLEKRTFLEFFAGIGLMRIGLEKQGWSLLYANDIDPLKHKMYEGHFGKNDNKFHLGDIHEICIENIPTATLATASFPCTDLSLAGLRAGLGGKQSSAFWGFIKILSELGDRKPPIILIENVTGFLTSCKGEDFTKALISLNDLGYSVDSFIIDAANFVPQSRQRLFIIGILDTVIEHSLILKEESYFLSFYGSDIRPNILAKFIFTHPEIRWHIQNIPQLPKRSIILNDIIDNSSEIINEWWSEERTEYLFNQMSPRHKKYAAEMISGSDWSYGTIFRRIRNGKSMAELRIDGIAGCLRTPKGGSGRQILFKAGKGKYFARLLSPRECAKLMGVGEYKVTVPLNQALFGFGDAVCVPVVEWIVKNYLNPFISQTLQRHHQTTK